MQNGSAMCFSHVLLGGSFVLISVCQLALSRCAANMSHVTLSLFLLLEFPCQHGERDAFGCPKQNKTKTVTDLEGSQKIQLSSRSGETMIFCNSQ